MKAVTPKELVSLQKDPRHIRHICIMAHVDHGKTTLADSLIASNGIISQKMAGKLRYMDSRKDEQERGITMKSSSVSIHYQKDEECYLINVIDSPGHVDFVGEVCTAVRLCDGAIILVDVVEGICPQTKTALQQAWIGHIRPLLVLNKIDRLILEWKLTPLDAYARLVQILEQVNAIMGELFATAVLKKSENANTNDESSNCDKQEFDWSNGLDDADDSTVYFSPEQGNVVFASALDGWGFGVSHFAKLFASKLGAKEEVLKRTLWGDFYFNSKTKQILRGAQAKAKRPLFVQFILENIWSVYDSVLIQRDNVMVEKIIKSLNLKIPPRDANHKDPKVKLQAIFAQWLPLSDSVLEMVCNFVPSPLELSEEKVESLMCSSSLKFDALPQETRKLKSDFLKCTPDKDAPVIVCISKMFPTEKRMLPENRQRPLTAEEIAERRERARQRHAEKNKIEQPAPESQTAAAEISDSAKEDIHDENNSEDDTAFIAFARVYSGTIYKGQQLYVLGPKHDPAKALKMDAPISEEITVHDLHPEQHITLATIKSLYLLMGKELIELNEVPAGNVIGIGGLQDHVLKSATLSSTIACPSFIDLYSSTVPILRVALEPCHPKEMSSLVKGLRLLNQADPCVQVFVQETGEHVLVSSGEVHLQRCVEDLKERFAKIDINVSAPIVPFRETIIPPPKIDMVNEVIEEKNQQKKISKVEGEILEEIDNDGCILVKTPNKLSSLKIRAKPLPPEIAKLLDESASLLKILDLVFYARNSGESDDILTPETIAAIKELKNKLHEHFSEAGSEWNDAVDQIWSFGPRRCGPNILLNRIPSYKRPSVFTDSSTECDSPHLNYDSTFVSGFQLATLCGPLCDEPMMGVCFIVEDWTFEKEAFTVVDDEIVDKALGKLDLNDDIISKDISRLSKECDTESIGSSIPSSSNSTPFGPFTGQIMSTVKDACKKAFQAQPQRLMCAMYSCNIQVPTDMLGKMYAVLGRRSGRVLHADMEEGSQTFHVIAELPVIESFDFANEIRKQTNGLALPQLVFSHWEVVDVDPFWSPRTEEEYAHFGEKADVENRARKYMNNVRRRKGLAVDEKIVEHAEKQRTLMRKK
ncbi:elongation factor-like GTPase 1 isoform X2 [Argiope bruennichi]|uniref:elongation factor-like GTPase 1 isoform X2 n=1 Tax=Argiope bruennichi TaxID=94029 RepID=UPI002494DD82|nr:elongation factor-like GTPase 1 isoform X2 [Argiope bruennichi]